MIRGGGKDGKEIFTVFSLCCFCYLSYHQIKWWLSESKVGDKIEEQGSNRMS